MPSTFPWASVPAAANSPEPQGHHPLHTRCVYTRVPLYTCPSCRTSLAYFEVIEMRIILLTHSISPRSITAYTPTRIRFAQNGVHRHTNSHTLRNTHTYTVALQTAIRNLEMKHKTLKYDPRTAVLHNKRRRKSAARRAIDNWILSPYFAQKTYFG